MVFIGKCRLLGAWGKGACCGSSHSKRTKGPRSTHGYVCSTLATTRWRRFFGCWLLAVGDVRGMAWHFSLLMVMNEGTPPPPPTRCGELVWQGLGGCKVVVRQV